MNASMTQIGFHQIIITPPIGFPTDGTGFAEMPGEEVADDLRVRVMSLEDAHGQRCVFVTADLLYIPRAMTWRIKRWAFDHLGLRPGAVILNASHTHSGPFLHPLNDPASVHYVEGIEKAIRVGIERSFADARPSDLSFGLLHSDWGISRRRLKEDGSCELALLPNPDNYFDPDLPVLMVKDATSGALRGVWWSYACHPTSRRGNYFSADYPGAVERHLKRTLGDDVAVHFAQGAGGDIKPRFFSADGKNFRQPDWNELDEAGAKLAQFIAESLTGSAFSPVDLDLATAELDFPVPYNLSGVPTEDELFAMLDSEEAAGAVKPLVRRGWARLMLEGMRQGTLPQHHQMTAAAIKLGSALTLVALSDEVVAGLGRAVKEAWGPGRCIFLGYTHFTEVYVPTAKMLIEGGYEPIRSLYYTLQHGVQPAPFAGSVEEVVVKAATDVMRMASSPRG